MKKKILKKVMGVAIAVMLIGSVLAGCQKAADTSGTADSSSTGDIKAGTDEKVSSSSDEKIVIRLATPWTPGSVSGAGDQIEALIQKFMEEHPNVTIMHDSQSTNDLRTKLTVEMAAGNPPDVSWCPVNYAREFIKDGLIIDWKDVIDDPAHPEWKEWFSEATIASLTEEDGTILLAPQEGSIDGLYYNKKMFDENGWKAPATWDDLMNLIPVIKEKGISPLVTGGKDSRFAWMASAILVRTTGLEKFRSLCLGADLTNWNSAETGFPKAMDKFKELVDAGAFPSGVLGMSATEVDQMFATGKAAMYYEGAWKPNNFLSAGGEEFLENVGRVDFPAMTDCPDGNANTRVGGCILGFMVASGLDPEKEALCIELTKQICSPEFNVPIMEKGAFVYAGNAEYNTEGCSAVMNDLIDAYRTAESYIPSMDCIAPPAVDLAIKQTAFPGIITGEYNAEQAVDEVQKAAEDYAASLTQE